MAKQQPTRTRRVSTPGPPKKPIGKWVAYGVGGVLVLALVLYLAIPPEKIPEGIPEGTVQVAVDDRSHIEGAIAYDVAVPPGGPHNPIPLDCGIYDFEVPTENAVHSLEHGAVWVTYHPDIGSDAVDKLESIVRIRKAILSPVAAQPAPIMATAWGFQLELDDPGDVRLRQFIQTFEDALTAPEPGAECVGGVAPTEANA